MTAKVSALIVTRNRIHTLKRTIESVLAQAYKVSEIIIVDNCSTDQTPVFLRSLTLPITTKIIYQENMGGAGGFNTGLKQFVKSKSDWCWLMDDDGWPSTTALENLEPDIFNGPKWRNSLVLNELNRDELSFGMCINGKLINKRIDVLNLKHPINICNPFNGTLLHKELVQNIGFPIADLFIKGDETEYMKRANRFGYITETYIESEFYHPAHREANIVRTEDNRAWVFYYKVRNHEAIGKKNGDYKLNKKAAYKMAKKYTKDILKASIKKQIKLKSAYSKLMIVWCGVFAAAINHPLKWFIPK